MGRVRGNTNRLFPRILSNLLATSQSPHREASTRLPQRTDPLIGKVQQLLFMIARRGRVKETHRTLDGMGQGSNGLPILAPQSPSYPGHTLGVSRRNARVICLTSLLSPPARSGRYATGLQICAEGSGESCARCGVPAGRLSTEFRTAMLDGFPRTASKPSASKRFTCCSVLFPVRAIRTTRWGSLCSRSRMARATCTPVRTGICSSRRTALNSSFSNVFCACWPLATLTTQWPIT